MGGLGLILTDNRGDTHVPSGSTYSLGEEAGGTGLGLQQESGQPQTHLHSASAAPMSQGHTPLSPVVKSQHL